MKDKNVNTNDNKNTALVSLPMFFTYTGLNYDDHAYERLLFKMKSSTTSD